MESTQNFSEIISKFELFNDLSKDPNALEELSSLMKHEIYQLRDYIINEKEADPRVFFLFKGQVEVNKTSDKGQNIVIARTDASSFPYFGESVLFGSFTRSANVIAYSHCECLSLSESDFKDFIKNHPFAAATFYRHLSKVLYERLSKATKDIFIASMELKK